MTDLSDFLPPTLWPTVAKVGRRPILRRVVAWSRGRVVAWRACLTLARIGWPASSDCQLHPLFRSRAVIVPSRRQCRPEPKSTCGYPTLAGMAACSVTNRQGLITTLPTWPGMTTLQLWPAKTISTALWKKVPPPGGAGPGVVSGEKMCEPISRFRGNRCSSSPRVGRVRWLSVKHAVCRPCHVRVI